MKDYFRRFWSQVDSLDDRIFYSIVFIGTLATFLAFLVGLIQGISPAANISTLCCYLWMLVLLIIGIYRPKSLPVCRVILVCGLNLVMLPPTYLSCGALSGGMILFYLVSLFLSAVLLHGRTRVVVTALSFVVLAGSVAFGYYHPELVHALTPQQGFEDILVTFCTTGPALVFMTVGILDAYNAERRQNKELVEQLSSLSIHDALSGLYNRRELFRRLDLIYQPKQDARVDHLKRESCYLAMFDIDNFKSLNDTYGHQFGDLVLSTVARTLDEAVLSEQGEFAARYGGEEFVCVLCQGDADAVFARVDAARQTVAGLAWADVPGLRVTISGGVVDCSHYDSLDKAMHDVDTLLYEAKRGGKNRIAR